MSKTTKILNNLREGDEVLDFVGPLGVASHAMVPQNGVNASFILFEFSNEVYPTSLSNFFVNSFKNRHITLLFG